MDQVSSGINTKHLIDCLKHRKWSRPLQWRHDGDDSVSNHQPHDCLLNGLFRRRSKKTSKLRVAGLCVGNSPGTGEFSAQMASNAENVSIWWRHHANTHIQFDRHIFKQILGIYMGGNTSPCFTIIFPLADSSPNSLN